jgi:hypothetical protein
VDLDATLLGDAFVIFSEFGPSLRTPRNERLKRAFPQLSEADVASLLEIMHQVRDSVWVLARHGGDSKLGAEAVTSELQRQHPFLRASALSRARFLVNYYAWHEGWSTQ